MVGFFKKISAFFVLVILFSSCEKSDVVSTNDYDYFPLEVGQYQLYQVNEVTYSISDTPVQSTYFLKERISGSFINAASQEVFKIERYKRLSQQDVWKIDSVWTTQRMPDKALRTENNISFIKMIFPITFSSTWNMNDFNSLPKKIVTYAKQKQTVSIEGKTYLQSISIIQRDDSTLISRDKNIEIYAPTVGLVFKEDKNLAYCQSSATCIGKGIIDYGHQKTVQLLEKGVE